MSRRQAHTLLLPLPRLQTPRSGNLCASVEAFIVPGCLALALRGFWPNAPKPPGPPCGAADAEAGGPVGGGGGGGGGGGEAAPLLLAAGGAPPGAPLVSSSGEAYGAAARRPQRRGGGAAWARLVAAGDTALAGLAVLVGGALVVNGIVQEFL
jgi:hypothetical protein